jgi:hypothetical protein
VAVDCAWAALPFIVAAKALAFAANELVAVAVAFAGPPSIAVEIAVAPAVLPLPPVAVAVAFAVPPSIAVEVVVALADPRVLKMPLPPVA